MISRIRNEHIFHRWRCSVLYRTFQATPGGVAIWSWNVRRGTETRGNVQRGILTKPCMTALWRGKTVATLLITYVMYNIRQKQLAFRMETARITHKQARNQGSQSGRTTPRPSAKGPLLKVKESIRACSKIKIVSSHSVFTVEWSSNKLYRIGAGLASGFEQQRHFTLWISYELATSLRQKNV